MSPIFVVALFFAIAITVGVLAHRAAERHRRELSCFAVDHQLQFNPDARTAHDRYAGYSPFGQGSSRRSSNLIQGRWNQIDWEMFDYQYTTGSGKNRTTHRVGVVAALITGGAGRVVFPRLDMRAEGLFDQLVSLAGFDINFESEQFSRRYHVRCEDRKFAYDLIHPHMIEYLMSAVAPRHWQLAGDRIVLTRNGRYSIAELGETMELVRGFVARIPGFVRQDRVIFEPSSPTGRA